MPNKLHVSTVHITSLMINKDLFEVGANGYNFVNKILDAENVKFAKNTLDDTVVGDGDALLVYFSVAALVDELANRLQVWFAE